MRGRRSPRQSRVKVSGCGCCLPIPLGVLALTSVGLRSAFVRLRSR